jgi:hypothetical protein
LLVSTLIYSQEKPSYFQPSLLRASATIAPTRFYNQHTTVALINGFVEYILEDKISVRGEGFVMVPKSPIIMFNTPKIFQRNCNGWYAGFGYHLGKKNWKMDIHAEPGILAAELVKNYNQNNVPESYQWSVNPSYLIKIGTTFYFSKVCHFFAEINFSDAWARKTAYTSLSMKQYGISAGLGFHLLTKKK